MTWRHDVKNIKQMDIIIYISELGGPKKNMETKKESTF